MPRTTRSRIETIKNAVLNACFYPFPPRPTIYPDNNEDYFTSACDRIEWNYEWALREEMSYLHDIGKILSNNSDYQNWSSPSLHHATATQARKIYYALEPFPDVQENLPGINPCWFVGFTWQKCTELHQWIKQTYENYCTPTKGDPFSPENIQQFLESIPESTSFAEEQTVPMDPDEAKLVDTMNWDYLLKDSPADDYPNSD